MNHLFTDHWPGNPLSKTNKLVSTEFKVCQMGNLENVGKSCDNLVSQGLERIKGEELELRVKVPEIKHCTHGGGV